MAQQAVAVEQLAVAHEALMREGAAAAAAVMATRTADAKADDTAGRRLEALEGRLEEQLEQQEGALAALHTAHAEHNDKATAEAELRLEAALQRERKTVQDETAARKDVEAAGQRKVAESARESLNSCSHASRASC